MISECGPWRCCDFHQYRSWLRKADSAPASLTPSDKEKQKTKKLRRRPAPGEFQLTFRHHTDPAEYERDYLTQVTHARCRAANPSATLLATELTTVRPTASASDRTVVQLLPPQPTPSVERQSPAVPALLDTASSPDLSTEPASSPPQPTPSSSPDLCRLPRIVVGGRAPRRRSLPPRSVPVSLGDAPCAPPVQPASTAAYRRPVGPAPSSSQSTIQPPDRQARSASVQQEEADHATGGAPRQRRQPSRQPSTPHTVTLDLPSPPGPGCVAQARRNGCRPRGLTKIQLASSVPENLTIIVGRKLEISLSGAKKGRQRGRGFR